MAEPAGRTILVINGRVHEVVARSVTHPPDPAAWWKALALLGGALIVLGVWVGIALGSVAAIGGVALFLAAGVLVGSERDEPAAALGSAGLVWTSVGVAVYLHTDPAVLVSAVAIAAVGTAVAGLGAVGWSRRRDPSRSVGP